MRLVKLLNNGTFKYPLLCYIWPVDYLNWSEIKGERNTMFKNQEQNVLKFKKQTLSVEILNTINCLKYICSSFYSK